MNAAATAHSIARELTGAAPAPSRLRASLSLDFVRDDSSGRTVLAASVQEPPLRVVRAFDLADSAALVHLHNVSGGLLGGDQLALSVCIAAGAGVQLTTTGATRIYRPRANAPVAAQRNEIHLAEGALLEYVPDPIIPYAGARFAQQTAIQLAPEAGLFWWEILAPGREASGELFEYERLEMKTRIAASGRPIAAESIRLEPRRFAVTSPARLGQFRYCATFYICRVGLAPAAWAALEQELRDAARALTRPGETLWGLSTLPSHGLIARVLARRGCDMLPGLRTLWRVAKLRLYGREPIPPRKVN